MIRRIVAICAVILGMLGISVDARAQIAVMPPELERVGVTEHLDEPLPLDAMLRDHTGKPVRLGDVFDGKKPVVLTFAYHTCPVVCSMIANNLARSLRDVGWSLGDQFTALTISINPNETLEDTAKKRASVLAEYGRLSPAEADASRAWSFLIGDEATIQRVADAAGFKFEYDEERKEWAHASLVMILKPDGRMARYLYGFEAAPADLKLGLFEASEGRSISTIEQIILYCYHYDPKGGRYVLVAQRVMQVGGGAVALVLLSVLGTFWARELRKSKKNKRQGDVPPSQNPQLRAPAPGDASA